MKNGGKNKSIAFIILFSIFYELANSYELVLKNLYYYLDITLLN